MERRSRYFRSAETGQVEESVALTVTVQPVRKGSVFEAFMCSWAERVTSARQSVRSGANKRMEGEQNSLARKKP